MNIIQAALYGIVEGLTEFLPVSSTFHLILTSAVLGISQSEFVKVFEVVIQVGAISAAVVLYFKDVMEDHSLIWKTGVAFIPTAIIGFLLHSVIKNVFFESLGLMLTAFAVVGVIFIVVEILISKKIIDASHSLTQLTYPMAALVGLAQAMAVVPGVSRAGAVIVALMVMGIKRSEAARFSFLLAIPTIGAAAAYDALKMRDVIFSYQSALPLILMGTVISGVVAFIVMKWFIGFLKQNTLIPFGIYRLILVIIVLLTGLSIK